MKLGRKAQLAPAKEQAAFFSDCCRAQRLVYNWALARHKDETERTRALVEKALATSDMETLLKFTTIGEVKDKTKPPATRSERIAALARLVVEWNEYNTELNRWKDMEKESRGDRPRCPKLGLRVTSMNELKRIWRDRDKGYRNKDHGFVEGDAWIQRVPSSVIDSAFNNLMAAYKRWFDYLRLPAAKKHLVPKVGYPRFKKRHANASFGYIRALSKSKNGKTSGGIQVTNDSIEVVNLGFVQLQEKGYLPVGRYPGKVSISTAGNRWFISITEDVDYEEQLPAGRPSVGIDVNVRNFATLYPSGEKIANPKILDQHYRRLQILQRRLSRKQKGSGRYEHCRKRINRLHHLIARTRADFQQQLSTELVRKYGRISVETLGIQAMLQEEMQLRGKKRRKLNRDILDMSWFEFRRQLTYKGELYGTEVTAVSRWFPSTKSCAECGGACKVNWRDRTCRCLDCGVVVDMDDNAAKNLLQEGLRMSTDD